MMVYTVNMPESGQELRLVDIVINYMCMISGIAYKYSQLFLRRTPLGPVLSVHLREVSVL